MHVMGNAQGISRIHCVRQVTSDCVPSTPGAPAPWVWHFVTSSLPDMVDLVISSLYEDIYSTIEEISVHFMCHWCMH